MRGDDVLIAHRTGLLDLHPCPADPSDLFLDVVLAPLFPAAFCVHRLGPPAPLVPAAIEQKLDGAGGHIAPELLVQFGLQHWRVPSEDVKEATHALSRRSSGERCRATHSSKELRGG